jgi:hypothetical protein
MRVLALPPWRIGSDETRFVAIHVASMPSSSCPLPSAGARLNVIDCPDPISTIRRSYPEMQMTIACRDFGKILAEIVSRIDGSRMTKS